VVGAASATVARGMAVVLHGPVVGAPVEHAYLLVFLSSLIEATGVPFPGRIVLVLTSAVVATQAQLFGVILAAFAGALIGDHLLYGAGRVQGPRLLTLYCRITLASDHCVENTIRYFRRFGASAVALARFSTGVRLFAAILSGCGHITYGRFVAFDVAGTVVYCSLWAGAGFVFGDDLIAILARPGPARAIVLIVPAGVVALLGYRWYRRWRYGRPSASSMAAASEAAASCQILVPR
jgi:membrane protein DedA with SNARE-associated domain